jgi:hypothetical protein
MTIKAAHPRPMHRNLAAVEADLALRRAPAVAHPASAGAVRRAGKLLRVLAQHLFDGPDLGRQTEALKRTVQSMRKFNIVVQHKKIANLKE